MVDPGCGDQIDRTADLGKGRLDLVSDRLKRDADLRGVPGMLIRCHNACLLTGMVTLSLIRWLLFRLHLIQTAFDVIYQDVEFIVTMRAAASRLIDVIGLCGLLLLIPAVNVALELVL